MQGFFYYISLPFIYLISCMPFWLLYRVSDGIYVLLYYVLGYRKKVVYQNLKNSFPDKTAHEIISIQKKYYKYLCDLILETLKGLTISPEEALKRCSIDAGMQKIFKNYNDKKQSVILVMGHWGNWEWSGNSFSIFMKHRLYVIYHPLSNKYFNSLIIRLRTRLGTKLIAMNDTIREMFKNRSEINATAFIADQTPSNENAYWTIFLNQDTPVFWGVEKIAKKMNVPVVYISVERIKRGYYVVHAEILTDEPQSLSDGQLTELHTRRLEADILRQPEIWLWSHKRWKHKRKG